MTCHCERFLRNNPTFLVVASEVRSLDHGASGAAGADFWRGAAI